MLDKMIPEDFKRIAEFCAERDALLRALDWRKVEPFIIKWSPDARRIARVEWPIREETANIVIHKARMIIETFTEEEKLASARWLFARGYKIPEPMKFELGILTGATYAKAN